MSISRPSIRLRHLAASTGALTLAGTLALSGVAGGGVEMTEAAWSDKEVSQGSVKATWMEGFTRVTNPGWRMHGQRDNDLPYSIGMTNPPGNATRDFVMSYPQLPGTALATGTDDNRSSFGTTTNSEIVPPRSPTNDLWMGRYSTSLNYDIARAGHCMSFPSPTSMTSTTNTCFAAAKNGNVFPRLVAHQNTLGYTYSISGSALDSKLARVNVSGFASTAQCFADGSSTATIAHDDSSVLELANGYVLVPRSNSFFNRERSIKEYIPVSDDPLKRYDGTTDQWARYNVNNGVNGQPDASFVLLANIRKNTFQASYYALAEMDLVIQVYSSGGSSSSNGRFIDQINLPLTRSECGFSNGASPLPPQAGTWREDPLQLVWPNRWRTTVTNATSRLESVTHPAVPSSFVPDSLPTSQAKSASGAEVAQAEIASQTATVTSPLENSIASETTTSGPPDPSVEGESTTAGTSTAATSTTRRTTVTSTTPTATAITTTAPTATAAPRSSTTPPATQTTISTAATPAVAIPDEPRPLSATARLEDVGTVTVGGDDLIVVVPGATVPTDARYGAAALEIWLAGGDPGTTWRTFASDDPDSDGWRWATISQKTGTVVYIR